MASGGACPRTERLSGRPNVRWTRDGLVTRYGATSGQVVRRRVSRLSSPIQHQVLIALLILDRVGPAAPPALPAGNGGRIPRPWFGPRRRNAGFAAPSPRAAAAGRHPGMDRGCHSRRHRPRDGDAGTHLPGGGGTGRRAVDSGPGGDPRPTSTPSSRRSATGRGTTPPGWRSPTGSTTTPPTSPTRPTPATGPRSSASRSPPPGGAAGSPAGAAGPGPRPAPGPGPPSGGSRPRPGGGSTSPAAGPSGTAPTRPPGAASPPGRSTPTRPPRSGRTAGSPASSCAPRRPGTGTAARSSATTRSPSSGCSGSPRTRAGPGTGRSTRAPGRGSTPPGRASGSSTRPPGGDPAARFPVARPPGGGENHETVPAEAPPWLPPRP
jgi:hypothetical protein